MEDSIKISIPETKMEDFIKISISENKINTIPKTENESIYLLTDLNDKCRFIKVLNHEEENFNKILDFFKNKNCDFDKVKYQEINIFDYKYDFLLNKDLIIEDSSDIENLILELKKQKEKENELAKINSTINNLKTRLGLEIPDKKNVSVIKPSSDTHNNMRKNKFSGSSWVDFKSEHELKLDNDKVQGLEKSENYTFLKNVFPESDKYIMYCEYFNLSFILDQNSPFVNILLKFNDRLGIFNILELKNDTYDENLLNDIFNNKIFNSRTEFESMIKVFQETIKNNKDIILENKINKYIKMRYEITTSDTDCIPAKQLNDNLTKYLKVKEDNLIAFRNKLGKILLKIGLQKKRKRDGIYYYGLILKKIDPETIERIESNLFENSLTELIKKRETDINIFFPMKI